MKPLPLLSAALFLASPALAQIAILDSAGGSFVDISGTGTPLSLADDGEVDITTTVGNDLVAAGDVRVGSNGAVRFNGGGQELLATNFSIPSLNAFAGDQVLMPFWDDIDSDGGNDGEIYWQEIGGTLIVQWEDVKFFGNLTDTATFQLQVFSSGPIWAQFIYTDIQQTRPSGGAGATIGYQSGGVANDVQWSFNAGGSVFDGTVLSVVGDVPLPPPVPCAGLTFVDNLPGTYMDIAGSGTPLSLPDDGAVDIVSTVGNQLLAAGTLRVASNGGVRFAGPGLALTAGNFPIPATGAFSEDQCLLPFWDDIDTDSGMDGEIFWQEIGGTLIVQWEAVKFFGNTVETATFQLQVPSSGLVFARFLYADIGQPRPGGGASATIGYQSGGVANHAQWSYNVADAVADGTILSLVFDGAIGASYCGPAVPNSTGLPGRLQVCGSTSLGDNDVNLTARQLPLGQFGYFLVGRTQGFFMPASSSGFICLSGDIGRYNDAPLIITGPSGTIRVDLTDLPTNFPGSQAVVPGETLNFQCWYRDFGSTSNFTDGRSVTF